MEVAHQASPNAQNTLALFKDEVGGFVDENNRHSDSFTAAGKFKDGRDLEMIAAERIARQLYKESNGPRITSKSRKKGNEICDHLIASLRNQPEQANLDF